MTTYEYRCQSCGEEFSRQEHMGEHASSHASCPRCGSDNVQQVFRSINVRTGKKS